MQLKKNAFWIYIQNLVRCLKKQKVMYHSGLSQGYFATFRGLLSIFPSTSSQVALLNLALLNLALLNLALLNLALLKNDSVKLGSVKI